MRRRAGRPRAAASASHGLERKHPMTRQKGLTLIELMIVVAITIPNLLSARLNSHETSAISTLRNLSSAEAQFQASAKADTDGDGTGEFGVFSELSGGAGVRVDDAGNRGAAIDPPVLSGAFRTTTDGTVSRSGYVFQVLLPATTGHGTTETGSGTTFTAPLSADLAETTWCSYAWPTSHGTSGNRTFFVNQTGDITAMTFEGGPSSQGCAFQNDGGHPNSITGKVAVGTRGRNLQMWKQVN